MNSDRPVTSKSRGICRYYNTHRGCFAGDKCKFLHGEAEKHTLYDQSKTCKYYVAGYCRRGAQCWFRHVKPGASSSVKEVPSSAEPTDEEEGQLCCICYEKPITYGLLDGCSHIFCLGCIREWRARNGKSEDVVASGVTKKCPLCRVSSRYITPSSQFFPEGHAGKAAIIEQYKASMARVPCRHFQASPPLNRFCPFGKDCFYQHLNEDGTPHVFRHGVDTCMRIYRRGMNQNYDSPHDLLGYMFDDLSATLDVIRANLPELVDDFGVIMDDGGSSEPRSESDGGQHVDAHVQAGGSESDGPLAERMERLVNLLSSDAAGGWMSLGTFNVSTPFAMDNYFPVTVDNFPEPSLVDAGDPLLADEAAIPSSSSSTSIADSDLEAEPTPQASGIIPVPELPRRFSTVVHRDGLGAESLDDLRPLPNTAVVRSASNESTSEVEAPTARALQDEQVAREAEALLGDTGDLDRRVQEVLRLETLGPGDRHSSLRIPAAEPARGETRSAPPELEALHDADPPFLTDGRGRVVWSSTTAGRHREGRRTRSGASASALAQQKVRREASDTDVVAVRAVERSVQDNEGILGRPRPAQRAQSSPEGSLVDEVGDFVIDGHGGVVLAGSEGSQAATAVVESAEVETIQGEGRDGDSAMESGLMRVLRRALMY